MQNIQLVEDISQIDVEYRRQREELTAQAQQKLQIEKTKLSEKVESLKQKLVKLRTAKTKSESKTKADGEAEARIRKELTKVASQNTQQFTKLVQQIIAQ